MNVNIFNFTAKNRSNGEHSNDYLGMNDQEKMMSLSVTPMKVDSTRRRTLHNHFATTPNTTHSSSNIPVDPYAVTSVQLQGLDTEQLRQLVLTLQSTTSR